MLRNYLTCALKPRKHNYLSLSTLEPFSATGEATAMRSLCTARKDSPLAIAREKPSCQQRPSTAINKVKLLFKKEHPLLFAALHFCFEVSFWQPEEQAQRTAENYKVYFLLGKKNILNFRSFVNQVARKAFLIFLSESFS